MPKQKKESEETIEEDFFEKFRKILPFLPITLLAGISTQLILLTKYNALILFSWGQVINDTVLLCIPFSIMAAWAYFWQTDSDYTSTKKKMVIRFFTTIFIGIVLVSLTNLILPKAWAVPQYLFFMYMAGLGYFHLLKSSNHKPAELNKRNFWRPLGMLLCILLIFGLLFFYLDKIYSFFIKDAYIETEGWSREKIQYVNDKYIIYGSGSVLTKNDKNVIVFSGGTAQ